MQGNANTGGELGGALTINGPALAPFAAIAGLDIKGHTTLNANFTTQGSTTKVELAGVVGVTGGKAPIPALIGDGAKLGVSATFAREDISIERAQLDGKILRISTNGSAKQGTLDLNWKVTLSDLAAVASTVAGRIEAQGRVRGATDNLELVADATGEAGTEGFPSGSIKVSARLQGLPGAPAGRRFEPSWRRSVRAVPPPMPRPRIIWPSIAPRLIPIMPPMPDMVSAVIQ